MSLETAAAPGRRRDRTRGARGGSAEAAPPIGRLVNPWKPVEILNDEQVARILGAAYRVLEEIGLEFRLPDARRILAANGAIVDDDTGAVRIGRDIVEAFVSKAPERFVLRARNRARDLHVGGDVVNFGPVNGAPNVHDAERGRRFGDLASLREIIRLNHRLGHLHWQGGVVVEPVDVPVPVRHLHINQAHVENADIVWATRGIGRVAALDGIRMSAIEHQCSLDDLAREPAVMIVTNTNSPRRIDEELLEGLMTMAEYGQCVVITPFTLMGAMAPVTLPGALVQQTAEALGVIALLQMIRPGTPAVLGGFTSNVDMRSGSPAFGTPEYVHATLAGAQIARALKLPYRSSAVNASPAVDAQSTYETAFSLWASIMSHSHLINHAAGWLEGGLVASYEKIIVDCEMLRGWAEILKPIAFSDDDLGLDAIRGVPPGGHFFGSPHTLARFETAFYRPLLSDWRNHESWRDAGGKDATARASAIWRRELDAYEPPPLDAAIREATIDFVARRSEEIGRGA
jgi:trimethylamine--corrinoid protein Co-methyltransferase